MVALRKENRSLKKELARKEKALAEAAVLHHHERWDGNGYPDGLAGEAIPLAARIISLAHVWDAIRDDRSYRAGFPLAEALTFMQDQSGVIFDPALVEVFLQFLKM